VKAIFHEIDRLLADTFILENTEGRINAKWVILFSSNYSSCISLGFCLFPFCFSPYFFLSSYSNRTKYK